MLGNIYNLHSKSQTHCSQVIRLDLKKTVGHAPRLAVLDPATPRRRGVALFLASLHSNVSLQRPERAARLGLHQNTSLEGKALRPPLEGGEKRAVCPSQKRLSAQSEKFFDHCRTALLVQMGRDLIQ